MLLRHCRPIGTATHRQRANLMQYNQIRSKEGDTLSSIAYQIYGDSIGQVERILNANPQLCRYPALLPAGIMINLPSEQPQAPTVQTLNLWD